LKHRSKSTVLAQPRPEHPAATPRMDSPNLL
jgi:hypothetical protein